MSMSQSKIRNKEKSFIKFNLLIKKFKNSQRYANHSENKMFLKSIWQFRRLTEERIFNAKHKVKTKMEKFKSNNFLRRAKNALPKPFHKLNFYIYLTKRTLKTLQDKKKPITSNFCFIWLRNSRSQPKIFLMNKQ